MRTPVWMGTASTVPPAVQASPGSGGLDSNSGPASTGHATLRKPPFRASVSRPRDGSSEGGGEGRGKARCLRGSRQGDWTRWFFLIWK